MSTAKVFLWSQINHKFLIMSLHMEDFLKSFRTNFNKLAEDGTVFHSSVQFLLVIFHCSQVNLISINQAHQNLRH